MSAGSFESHLQKIADEKRAAKEAKATKPKKESQHEQQLAEAQRRADLIKETEDFAASFVPELLAAFEKAFGGKSNTGTVVETSSSLEVVYTWSNNEVETAPSIDICIGPPHDVDTIRRPPIALTPYAAARVILAKQGEQPKYESNILPLYNRRPDVGWLKGALLRLAKHL